jgi:hypothetical protein
MKEKLKSLIADDRSFYSILLVFVAFSSFLLGRSSLPENKHLMAQDGSVMPTQATKVPQVATLPEVAPFSKEAESAPSASLTGGQVVASKSGTKYHLPTCPGAKQIKEANKIVFDSVAAAEAAGYKPAANCPGLP